MLRNRAEKKNFYACYHLTSASIPAGRSISAPHLHLRGRRIAGGTSSTKRVMTAERSANEPMFVCPHSIHGVHASKSPLCLFPSAAYAALRL